MHPDLTRRVRLVMAWNRLVYYRGLPTWLGWNLRVRESGCVFKKAARYR
jgi:hypothetical protein